MRSAVIQVLQAHKEALRYELGVVDLAHSGCADREWMFYIGDGIYAQPEADA